MPFTTFGGAEAESSVCQVIRHTYKGVWLNKPHGLKQLAAQIRTEVVEVLTSKPMYCSVYEIATSF